jgi:hypothetical protein
MRRRCPLTRALSGLLAKGCALDIPAVSHEL